MTTWTQMQAIQFDATLARSKRERAIVETAPSTLFPDLLPEAKRPTVKVVAELDGQADMFA